MCWATSTAGAARSSAMEERGGSQIMRANVPLAEMFGYVNDLRSMTSGRASYSMEFSHYEETPRTIAEEVKAKSAGKVVRANLALNPQQLHGSVTVVDGSSGGLDCCRPGPTGPGYSPRSTRR